MCLMEQQVTSRGSRPATPQHTDLNHKTFPPTSPKARVEVGLLSAPWGGGIYDGVGNVLS